MSLNNSEFQMLKSCSVGLFTKPLIDKMTLLGMSDEATASSRASSAKIFILLVSQGLTRHHLQHSILW